MLAPLLMQTSLAKPLTVSRSSLLMTLVFTLLLPISQNWNVYISLLAGTATDDGTLIKLNDNELVFLAKFLAAVSSICHAEHAPPLHTLAGYTKDTPKLMKKIPLREVSFSFLSSLRLCFSLASYRCQQPIAQKPVRTSHSCYFKHSPSSSRCSRHTQLLHPSWSNSLQPSLGMESNQGSWIRYFLSPSSLLS
jgi:hypothetical protein